MIILHNSGQQQVDVNHKLDVSSLLSSMEIAKVAKAISPANFVTFASSIVGNTVVSGMVGAHSPRKNGIKSGMGFVPRDPERVGSSRNKPIMKMLPWITIPLQGMGAPGPQVRRSNDGIGLVAERPAVTCKVHRKRLGHGSQPNSKLCSGARVKAASKDTSKDSAIRDARG